MKKVTLLATIILTLAMCASAQQLVDFTQLPASGSPQPVPTDTTVCAGMPLSLCLPRCIPTRTCI